MDCIKHIRNSPIHTHNKALQHTLHQLLAGYSKFTQKHNRHNFFFRNFTLVSSRRSKITQFTYFCIQTSGNSIIIYNIFWLSLSSQLFKKIVFFSSFSNMNRLYTYMLHKYTGFFFCCIQFTNYNKLTKQCQNYILFLHNCTKIIQIKSELFYVCMYKTYCTLFVLITKLGI